MANFRGIDHLNIKVNNINESIGWYEKVFGLELKERGQSSFGNDYAIIGKSGRGFLCIYPINEDIKVPRLNHIGFQVDNFDEFVDFVLAENIEIKYYGPEAVIHYPKSKSIYINDPNGIEIEVSSVFGGGL